MPGYVTVEYACEAEKTHYCRRPFPVQSYWAHGPCAESADCDDAVDGVCWGRVMEVREIRPMRKSRRQTQSEEG